MTPLIEIRNLKKRYPPAPDSKDKQGNLAVKGINLTIERGEIYSLLGPNGAGKTTTISMMLFVMNAHILPLFAGAPSLSPR